MGPFWVAACFLQESTYQSLFGLIRTVMVVLGARIFQNCNVNGIIMREKSSEDTIEPQLAVGLGFPPQQVASPPVDAHHQMPFCSIPALLITI